MTRKRQQAGATPSYRPRTVRPEPGAAREARGAESKGPAATTARWLGWLVPAVLVVTSSCEACHCDPHRNKPWRNLADPPIEPSPELRGEHGSAGQGDHASILAARPHTLRVHMDAEPRGLVPLVAPSLWTLRISMGTVFETLIRDAPPPGGAGSGPGSYQPGLATAWTESADGREILVELRNDVRFHDGKRMTSGDVQFSLDSARDPRVDADYLRARLADIDAVDRAGPYAVRIKLRRPSGWVLRALAEVPILPEHVYTGQLRSSRGPVVGTGPYALASWKDGVVHLHARDDYWGPRPAIGDIEFVHEPDAARALIAAKRGEIDLVPELIPEHLEQSSAPGIKGSFAELRLRPPVFRYLVFGAARPPFDDPRVRRAAALLVDRKDIAAATHNLARPIAGPVWPGGPGDGPSPAPPPYDPAEAFKLLDAAGWRDSDRDRRRERHGQLLRVAFLVADGDDAERDAITRNLRGAGFVVDERPGKPAYLLTRLRAGDFDLALVEWRGTVDGDLSPLIETAGVDNFGKFSSPAVDQAVQALREAWNPATRATRMGALAAALAEEWPLAGVVAPDPRGLIHHRVRGAVVWNGWLSLPELSLAAE